jgi:outer membrane protein W
MMKTRSVLMTAAATVASFTAMPALAQDAGDSYVKVAASRTKLVDKGEVRTNGVLDPAADYETRGARHGTVTGGYFIMNRVAIEGSISTPQTTNNIPAGSLAGLPNLGDDEFITFTLGGSLHPFKGAVQPYVGGGIQVQITTQQRDGLANGLNIPNSHGPYINGGVEFNLSQRLGVFVDVRKAFYHTNATGLLAGAQVNAKAVLDPLTVSIGAVARFGRNADSKAEPVAPGTNKWSIRAGFSSLRLSDEVKLNVGGAPFAGAGLSTFEHATPSVQIGRFLTKNIAVNATLGLPPKISIYGGGSIGVLPNGSGGFTGKLGEITYGPTAFTLQYHLTRSGRIRPYVGAGVSYMITFDTKDSAFQKLKVSDDLAPALEVGTDIMVGNKTGLFVDVKRAFLRPTAYGEFQGAPVVGKTRLDPWVFSGGFAFHF